MRYILLSVLLLAGCENVTKVEKLGEPRVQEKSISCHHYSYCYTCMPGTGSGCGFKFSHFCSGNQKAIVSTQEKRYYYESGKINVIDETTVVKELEFCH